MIHFCALDAIYEEFTVQTFHLTVVLNRIVNLQDTGYMISGRISGTALTDTGVVRHGHSQGERTRGHADCDTFKFLVTALATGTGRVWNDNGNGQDITDNVTNTIKLGRHGHGLGHGHKHWHGHKHGH